jgi:hypothetical protein
MEKTGALGGLTDLRRALNTSVHDGLLRPRLCISSLRALRYRIPDRLLELPPFLVNVPAQRTNIFVAPMLDLGWNIVIDRSVHAPSHTFNVRRNAVCAFNSDPNQATDGINKFARKSRWRSEKAWAEIKPVSHQQQ